MDMMIMFRERQVLSLKDFEIRFLINRVKCDVLFEGRGLIGMSMRHSSG